MKYILMHRETVVAVLSVNDISGTVYRVDDVLQPAHLPIGLYAPRPQGACQESESLVGRTYHPCQPFGISPCAGGFAGSEEVTAVRQHFDDEVLCTSLSDQYWLNPAEQPLEWSKVNFYNNDFSEDVGNILFGQIPQQDSIDLAPPATPRTAG